MIGSLSFSAAFAAASASSFPRIPTWLGTQQNNTVLFTSAEYFSNTSKTKRWSMCWCSIAWRHDTESTQIEYLSVYELFTRSRASWIARSSAVYMDACPGKRLLTILQFETTAHPTLWSSFEPSVYRNYLSWMSLKSPWNTNGLVSTFFTVFRPYIINGDSSCQGGDSGMVAWRIVSIFIFASSIRSLIRNPKVGIAFGLMAQIS